MTYSRSWPVPLGVNTVHLVGDMHAGAAYASRHQKMIDDILGSPVAGNIVGHAICGDITDLGTPEQDAAALAILAQLPFPWHPVMGGHDIQNDVRTPAAWASAYSVSSHNRSVDLGFCKLIILGPNSYVNYLTSDALTFLASALAATTKPCIVATHQPLANTVGGDTATHYSSFDAGWGYDRTNIDPILADNPHAKVWVSGHTHSSIDTDGFVFPFTVGGKQRVHINGSSMYYQDKTGLLTRHSPLQSIFVTLLSDRVQVRFRDHGGHCWVGPAATGRVSEVML